MMLQGMIQNFVRSTLSLTFVIAAARVVFNIKARMARETSWQLELKGDLTKQRRVEAVDKLLSVMTLLVSLVFGLQAIGLDGEQQLCLHKQSCSMHESRCFTGVLACPAMLASRVRAHQQVAASSSIYVFLPPALYTAHTAQTFEPA